MFNSLHTDVVSVLKKDGSKFDEIKASVQNDKIFIEGAKPFIESGDLIYRKMSNGGEEIYEVIDPGFHEQFHGISAHYQMQVRKLGIPEAKQAAQNITYNLNGNNARLNQGSVDNSTNVVNINSNAIELLEQLRSEVQKLDISTEEKQAAGEYLDVINMQIQSEKPSKPVITRMLEILPNVESITTIAASLLGIFS
jgi:hypothetical protein